jgi:hypothetical protein
MRVKSSLFCAATMLALAACDQDAVGPPPSGAVRSMSMSQKNRVDVITNASPATMRGPTDSGGR